jgi:outer membrane protein assembly factor BamB
VTTVDGQQHLVIQVHRRILGVDPATGAVLWSLPFVTPCDQNIVTPLRAADVIVVSSMGTGTKGIRVARHGAQWTATIAWETPEVSMYMSSPVLVNGRVVGLSHRKKGQYFALDPATGAVQWLGAPNQGENAAFVLADGVLLALQGDGMLLVLRPEGAAVSPAHRYRVSTDGTFAHPVPTELGILVKDENGLSLHGFGARAASTEAARP